jgi:hypothetical protein
MEEVVAKDRPKKQPNLYGIEGHDSGSTVVLKLQSACLRISAVQSSSSELKKEPFIQMSNLNEGIRKGGCA